MRGLLIGMDREVAAWIWTQFNLVEMQYCRAIGVINPEVPEEGLQGAALFQNWNGNNVDFSYYGRQTLSLGLVRALARVALADLHVSRATLTVSKKNKRLRAFLPRIGARLEGTSRRFYGPHDWACNTAVRFVLFKEQLQHLAGEYHHAVNGSAGVQSFRDESPEQLVAG